MAWTFIFMYAAAKSSCNMYENREYHIEWKNDTEWSEIETHQSGTRHTARTKNIVALLAIICISLGQSHFWRRFLIECRRTSINNDDKTEKKNCQFQFDVLEPLYYGELKQNAESSTTQWLDTSNSKNYCRSVGIITLNSAW